MPHNSEPLVVPNITTDVYYGWLLTTNFLPATSMWQKIRKRSERSAGWNLTIENVLTFRDCFL
eukprot:11777556-Karenia_brevis.AAC.1